ncbi:hypothetical protein EC957_011063 [Mortierella hygrophila]|uniref:Uncharacterized protein n=1 Tax=Mortierella hygrophila TaxID=979708 RepID=A0A9P6F893_9FUNG|nr:hypothetical protein EC957_011063 [Mortierella hygrophila]
MNQQPPTKLDPSSSFSSTTITSTTGDASKPQRSDEAAIIGYIREEMERKCRQLQDVECAYTYLTTHWEDQMNLEAFAIHRHGYVVHQCWHTSVATWNYRDRLQEAVVKLESELKEIRQELRDIVIAIGRK